MLGGSMASAGSAPARAISPIGHAAPTSDAVPANPTTSAANGAWTSLPGASVPSARYGVQMAYDVADGYTLLFGGCGDVACFGTGVTLGDTWTFKAGIWTQLFPAVSPPARGQGAMAYDPSCSCVLMYGGYNSGDYGLGDTWEFKAGVWTQIFTTVHPPWAEGFPMTYDAADGYMLMFGGSVANTTSANETWKFQSNEWVLIDTPHAPGIRAGEGLAYDATDGYVLLMGGNGPGSGQYWTDTWKYLDGNWTQIYDPTHPTGISNNGMAYDPAENGVVLWEGYINGTLLNNTWLFSGGHWTELSEPVAPSPRWNEVLAYDTADSELLMVGGWDGSQALPDDWTFAGGHWSEIPPPVPPERYGAQVAYDAADGYTLLFGGCANTACYGSDVTLGDTWTYQAGVWTELHPAVSPPARGQGGMAYDPSCTCVVMFGGYHSGSSTLGDTWEFKAGAWTQVFPATHPPAGEGTALAYDTADGYLLLFGGGSNATVSSQTWKFQAGDWTLLNPVVAPPARMGPGLAYDAKDGYVLMQGGNTAGGGYATDTWSFLDGNWTQLYSNPHPNGVSNGGMTYDSTDGYVLLWDGYANGTVMNFTWAWSNGQWVQLPTPRAPSPRWNEVLANDPSDGVVLMVGGWDGSQALPDDWTWSGSLVYPLAVSIAASASSVDAGQSVSFTATATGGSGGYAYAWSFDSAGLGCPSAPTTATVLCTPTSAGAYTASVTATDSQSDHASSGVLEETVYAGLTVALSAVPAAGEVGSSVNLTGSIVGGDPSAGGVGYHYGLSVSGSGLDCQDQGQARGVAWYACQATTVGNYTVVFNATDDLGVGASSHLLYTVGNGPVALVPTASVASSDAGQSVTFRTSAYGGSGVYPTFAWQGLPAGTCTGLTTDAATCTLTTAGTLSVLAQVTDSAGQTSAWTSALTFVVVPDPSVSITPTLTVAAGSPTSISATVVGGTAPYTAGWSVNGTSVVGVSGTTYSVVFDHGGTYTVVASIEDADGEHATSSPCLVTVQWPTSTTPPPAKQQSSSTSGFTQLETWALVAGVLVAVCAVVAFSLRGRRNRGLQGGAGVAMGGASAASPGSAWDEYQVARGGVTLPPAGPANTPPPPPGGQRPASGTNGSPNAGNENLRNLL